MNKIYMWCLIVIILLLSVVFYSFRLIEPFNEQGFLITGSPNFLQHLPIKKPYTLTPPLTQWKPYIDHLYYDPWWAISYPYNQLCDASARRNCDNSWHPRSCYREQYNKCITNEVLLPYEGRVEEIDPPIKPNDRAYFRTCTQKAYDKDKIE